MKAIIVTSQINFTPENYNTLVLGMSDLPDIRGVVVVKNRDLRLITSALWTIASQTAPALGWQYVKNFCTSFLNRRKARFSSQGKGYWEFADLNDGRFIQLLESEGINLVINARNNQPLPLKILVDPKVKCVNIHHGLLPEQKGFMCDFWAHIDQTKSGFTLHEIRPQGTDGPVIRRVEVPRSTIGYLEYLERSTLLEVAMLRNFMGELRKTGYWHSASQGLPIAFRVHKHPTLIDFDNFKRKGLKI